MLDTILGTKMKMSQTFVGKTRVPVTVVKAGPCFVTQIKNIEKDGYYAVQLSFGEKKLKNMTNALQGHLKKSGTISENLAPRFLREIRLEKESDLKVGDKITLNDVLGKGDTVQVTGISKGKGFAGVVKRWGFAGGPKTHGQSDRERAPGSIGQGTTPGRVFKGKKMGGRMGSEQKTIKNLKVVNLNEEKGEVKVKGPVPGIPGGLVMIKVLKKKEAYKE